MRGLTSKTSSGIYNYDYNPERRTANSRSGNTFCGITYRRIIEERPTSSNQTVHSWKAESRHVQSSGSEPQPKELHPQEESTNDEMQYYTRLHILTQAIVKAGPARAVTFSRQSHHDVLSYMARIRDDRFGESHGDNGYHHTGDSRRRTPLRAPSRFYTHTSDTSDSSDSSDSLFDTALEKVMWALKRIKAR